MCERPFEIEEESERWTHVKSSFCESVPTPIGTYDGSLKSVSAPDMGKIAIKAVLDRSKLDPAKVGTVVMGNVIQAGNKMNPARQSAVNSGIPVDVPAMTVNRVCGSGAQGIASAAQEVMLGMLDSAIAGGMENMDMAPYLVANGRWGYRMGDASEPQQMMNGAIATARICGQRLHFSQHQQMSSSLWTRSGSGGLRRQSRTLT
jgi:acetyl-CoA C-acetyltransferase